MGNSVEDGQILVWKMKKISILVKSIGNMFFMIKTKSGLSTSIFILSTNS